MSALIDEEYNVIPVEWNERFQEKKDFFEIDEKFPISKNKNNNVVSIFNDDIWDLSPYYHTKRKTKINFNKIKTTSLVLEVKKLLIMVMLYKNGRSDSFLSAQSLTQEYYGNCLFVLSNYAYEQQISIETILSKEALLKRYILQYIKSKKQREALSSYLSFLSNSNKVYSDFIKYDLSEIKSYLKSTILKESSDKKQTEVIPSRIFYNSLKLRWKQVEEIINHKESLSDLIINFVMNKSKKISFSEWKTISYKFGLTELFDKYEVSSKVSFTKFYYQFQGTCKHLIHAYTGMRDNEALMLKNNCLSEQEHNSKIVRILGITTKLHGTSKAINWVTTKEIVKVIETLKYFNKVICEELNVEHEEVPLFISSNTLKKGFIEYKYEFKSNRFLPLDEKVITIQEEDILQLEEIDCFRDWRNEDDKTIGKPWNFKTHQYRRSLAFYSLQSGIVSIGSLQIQLKHLFKEMSLYYAKGAGLTSGIISDSTKSHIYNDIQDLKPTIDALSYIKNVIFSDEKLFGCHGTFIEKNIKKNVDYKTYVLENREKTIKQFQNGELSYKETAIGGCVSTEACDSRLTRSITACIDCEGGVLKEKNLNNVISNQENFLKFLDKESIEYQTELKDLKILQNYREKILGEEYVKSH